MRPKREEMNRALRSVMILSLSSGFLACKDRREVDATVKTDETKAAIMGVCDQGFEPEGEHGVRLKDACSCLITKGGDVARLATLYCDDAGEKYFDRLVSVGKAEGNLVLTDTAGNSPDAEAAACAAQLAELRVESLIKRLADACNKDDTQTIINFLTIPPEPLAGQCWRLVHMTADGCVEAMPCMGKGSAHLAVLPITSDSLAGWPGADPVSEGQAVRLCNTKIKAMHTLKDPNAVMERYNYPFANYLSLGRSNVNVTYGAANCHGTAQALAGGILNDVVVEKLDYQSPMVRTKCSSLAETAFENARGRTNGLPTGTELPIAKGGHVINMNHDTACSSEECGDVSFNTFACDGNELESYIFHGNICINCWGKRLEKAGYKPLSTTATWQDLQPGCILTQDDHSITNVFQNDGFCYFYESLSPFAAPQLNVSDCQSLFAAFPRRWCPVRPFRFDLMP